MTVGGERKHSEDRLGTRSFQPPAIMLQISPTASSSESESSTCMPSIAEATAVAAWAFIWISQQPRMAPE